jgi:hypothetical protein
MVTSHSFQLLPRSHVIRRWTFYILLIWTGVILISLLFVPETYHPVLLARKAAKLRAATNNQSCYSASERAMAGKSIPRAILISLYRPIQLLFLEPMCSCLCIYSALVLGILYLFFGAFPLVFSTNHGFLLWQDGLSFLGLLVGSFSAVCTQPFWQKNYMRLVANWRRDFANGDPLKKPDPELRLPPTMLGSILVTVGLFWFGWTSYSSVYWIVPIIGSVFFAAG